uniref:Uncharacterized protein n=1 Tax=Anguilla anguilla TaxID=7936 RepID=A0A0E9RI55_ANGAN
MPLTILYISNTSNLCVVLLMLTFLLVCQFQKWFFLLNFAFKASLPETE